jgi:hypothetical protein
MINTYIEFAKAEISKNNFITFPEELFEKISEDEAQQIVNGIEKYAMMMLPEKEIAFFEWLKVEDNPVWKDLWVDDEYAPYLVSISFLPFLVYKSHANGFPICDLVNLDNYYFTINMMIAENSQMVLEAAKERFKLKRKLDLHHLLALEIAFNSTDIWHFAFKYHITIDSAKQALDILVKDNAILHFTKAEDVGKYLQF